MAKYIAIRSYRLKPGVDRSAFEQAFAHVEDPDASVGFERAILLQGYLVLPRFRGQWMVGVVWGAITSLRVG